MRSGEANSEFIRCLILFLSISPDTVDIFFQVNLVNNFTSSSLSPKPSFSAKNYSSLKLVDELSCHAVPLDDSRGDRGLIWREGSVVFELAGPETDSLLSDSTLFLSKPKKPLTDPLLPAVPIILSRST